MEASIEKDTQELTTKIVTLTVADQETNDDEIPTLVHPELYTDKTGKHCEENDQVRDENDKVRDENDKVRDENDKVSEGNDKVSEDNDKVGELDKNSQKYRLAMVEKALSDVRSMRSYTSASTIAPEVIKQQVKKNIDIKLKKMERKKAVAKGEASATTRDRRDNRETIRESHGLWGWDE